MLAYLLLLPLAIASPLYSRQNTTGGNVTSPSTGSGTGSASTPSVTLYPHGSGNEPVKVSGLAFPQFGQDVYLGLPFAQPPVGDLRFTPPQPAVYNGSAVTATTQPPACLQNPNGSLVGSFGISEDCLYLNVFTPQGAGAKTAYLPVMVWVYGGSFVAGAANFYNATAIVGQSILSKKDVIVVTVNYRLGIFGFGQGEEIAKNGAANLGLKDVRLALDWVQENIWAFGGNPGQVTVFGESAGAILISLLYLDPTIKTFHSAIMESGAQSVAPIGPTGTTFQAVYDDIVMFTNCSASNGTGTGTPARNQSSFECLKSLPAEALLAAQLETEAMAQYAVAFVFAPSIDGALIPDSPHTLLAEGKFAKIPFISGNNQDEGTVFTPTYVNSTQELVIGESFGQPIPPNSTTFGELLTLYPDVPSKGSPFNTGNNTFGLSSQFKRFAAILGDGTFQGGRRWFLLNAQKYGLTDTWSYLFNEYTPGALPYLGSYHGSEVAFVFGEVSAATNYSASAVALSKTMIDYWLNFALYTDPSAAPGGSNSTHWPKYGSEKTLLQLNGTNYTTIPDTYRQTQIEFFLSEPKAFNLRR